jgi:PhnB protein
MGSDAPPTRYGEPRGFSVTLQIKDPANAERIFNTLGGKGTVQMPFQPTFWGLRFGMVIDRFGISWMINCDQPA